MKTDEGGHFAAEFPPWQAYTIFFPEMISIPALPPEEYELEFYIRCDNPNLILIAQFGNMYLQESLSKAYGHSFDTRMIADGKWHRVSAPLSDFYILPDNGENNWTNLALMFIWVVSEGTEGAVFDIDEIRVRKVLPE